jgi:hypothetical protein
LADALSKNRTVGQEMMDVAAGILDVPTQHEQPVGK